MCRLIQTTPVRCSSTPAAEQASRVWIIPVLKRKIAIIAATESRMAHGSKVPITGTSNEKPKPRKCHASRNQVWSANQIARLRMTPTTAAVMPASAPLRGLRYICLEYQRWARRLRTCGGGPDQARGQKDRPPQHAQLFAILICASAAFSPSASLLAQKCMKNRCG